MSTLTRNLTPDEFLKEIDSLLIEGIKSSKHPFHQCAFATLNNQSIEQRFVVLRQWVLKRQTLIFHTDIRSPKVSQIKKNNDCSILFYSKQDKLQLRFKCKAHVHHKNRMSQFLFSKTTISQQRCYMTPFSPSSEKNPKQTNTVQCNPEENFAVCVCNFNELELLFLNYEEHIRIYYEWDKFGNLNSRFINP